MPQQSSVYALILFASGLIAAVLFFLVWYRRHAPGALPLAIWLLALIVWSWTYALHWLFPALPAPFFWLDATYLGVVAVPAAFFVFSLQLTHHGGWLTPKKLWLLGVEPLITLLLLWSDPAHGLFFGGKRPQTTSVILDGGPWFWINVVYSYSLLLIGLILLIRGFVRASGTLYRQQIGAAVLGAVFPLAANLAELVGLRPLPGLDLTPTLFIVSGVFYSYSILRFRLFDIVPVAHGALLENMQDGILVLDAQYRIIEINSAARKLLGVRKSKIIGQEACDCLTQWPELHQALQASNDDRIRFQQSFDDQSIYDVQVTRLHDPSGKFQGHLLTWRDISLLKKVEKELRLANEQLRSQLVTIESLQASLREQAIRDPLTNLYNRRYLQEALPQEIALANRRGYPISFLLLDIDHFKEINDQYGHGFGDAVLKKLAEQLLTFTRQGDLVVRQGGEEFLIVLLDAPLKAARERADDLRRRIETIPFHHNGQAVNVTLSIGLATYPVHGTEASEVLRLADQALYQAKSLGRNVVVSYYPG